jgi:D-glycero-alpha-D-manno-heptose-7-phosphate kinase
MGETSGGFGELLHGACQSKRILSARDSNSFADEIYGAAIEAGAMGGKLTGAGGGGGFMLLLEPPEKQRVILERFIQLIHVPFKIEFSRR